MVIVKIKTIQELKDIEPSAYAQLGSWLIYPQDDRGFRKVKVDDKSK